MICDRTAPCSSTLSALLLCLPFTCNVYNEVSTPPSGAGSGGTTIEAGPTGGAGGGKAGGGSGTSGAAGVSGTGGSGAPDANLDGPSGAAGAAGGDLDATGVGGTSGSGGASGTGGASGGGGAAGTLIDSGPPSDASIVDAWVDTGPVDGSAGAAGSDATGGSAGTGGIGGSAGSSGSGGSAGTAGTSGSGGSSGGIDSGSSDAHTDMGGSQDAPGDTDGGICSGGTCKRVFVSSASPGTNGALGGLAPADSFCQSAADARQLGGTWKAWLSNSSSSAASRLTHATVPYRLLDGSTVAANWTALVSGTLSKSIDVTETGVVVPSGTPLEVWTGTTTAGAYSGNTCNGWSDGTSSQTAFVGLTSATNASWTAAYTQFCDRSTLRLYCIEQ